MTTFKMIVISVILLGITMRDAQAQGTVQAGIFAAPATNVISVKAKPSAGLNGTLSSVNVTVRWLTSYTITLTLETANYSILPIGAVGTSGSYSYQTFGSVPSVAINWSANSENELFTARVDGNSGTGTFELTNTPAGAEWYFEFGGVDITNNTFYVQAVGNIQLPIQLSRFIATVVNQSSVQLDWTTATETNNFGFEVQKSSGNTQNFQTITNSFIPGHGTTLEPRQYSYVDFTTPGSWFYRLKQIDLDGTIHYAEPIQITVLTSVDDKSLPTSFAVHQNYPNPFNPSTTIKYDIPNEGLVRLEVFNLLGQKIATILNEVKQAGSYTQQFNAAGLTSGVYVYKLTASGFSISRRMVLIK